MSLQDFYDVLRVVNAVLSVVIFGLALVKAPKLWPTVPMGRRLVHSAHMLLVVTVGFAGLESYVQDIEGTYVISSITVVLIISMVAYLWPDPPIEWMVRRKK